MENDATSERTGNVNVVEGAKPNKKEGALEASCAILHLVRSKEAEQKRGSELELPSLPPMKMTELPIGQG
ncbi:hypothetical protein MA16_Dca011225 [Dendrobium catenatum]|uniref:Uncharacterized protein n=1 Tax=Dendrobium catenatum TaxID=906689 RepID=A0A2I0VW72_9ASPA|nr:hypothetical protein MA16_Dca011225 [Dendrobium catenatum]